MIAVPVFVEWRLIMGKRKKRLLIGLSVTVAVIAVLSLAAVYILVITTMQM